MGTAYEARQSSFSDGDTIDAADSNSEFDAILGAFGTSGHTHDGTGGEGGNVTALRGHALTFGLGTAGTDVVLTFDGESSDGVLSWMEDEDQFKFDDDVQIIDDKSLILGTNEDITIKYDETTNNALEIAANVEGAALGIVLKADQGDDAGDEWKLNVADGGTLTLGNDINSAGTYVTHMTLTPNSTVASSTAAFAGSVTAGSATIDDIALDGKVLTITGSPDDTFSITTGANGATTLEAVDTAGELGTITLNADGRIFLDAGDTYGGVYFEKTGTSYAAVFTAGTVVGLQNLIDNGTLAFQGVDGGSTINALQLQMANAGKAIFNAGATFADDVTVENINLSDRVLTIIGDTDDTFKITSGTDGATTLATVDTAGNAANLTLSADGRMDYIAGDASGQHRFFGGSMGLAILPGSGNSGTDATIRNNTADGDLLLVGNDGGSYITALKLDMSEAGAATFNNRVTAAALTVDDIDLNVKTITITGSPDDTFTITAGTDGATTLATVDTAAAAAHLILDADGVIVLDGGDAQGSVFFKNNNTTYATMYNSGNNLYIKSEVSDGDLILQGNDGGVAVTALTLDMSAGGGAHFSQYLKSPNYFWSNTDNGQVLRFGTSAEIQVHHVHDVGLTFSNNKADTDNRPFVLQLKSEEDAIVADNVIGSLEFAAGDSSGTDAATVAAGIHAISEGEFTASANPTRLSFTTGASETAAASATPKMTLSSAGKLGIGTTAPSELLHIASTGDAIIKLEADTDNSDETHNPKIMFSQDGGAATARVGYTSGLNTFEVFNEYGDALLFGTNNTERMRIKNAGNVGIGTTDPLKKLHVNGPALSTVTALTDASTVTPNFDTAQNFTLTLAGNRTLANPSNLDAGQTGSIFITQDGTGSRTLAFGNKFAFVGGTTPTLTTTAAAVDRIDYIVMSSSIIQAAVSLDVKVPS